jgi:hypothetical protein
LSKRPAGLRLAGRCLCAFQKHRALTVRAKRRRAGLGSLRRRELLQCSTRAGRV